jgi:PLP dependent protein
MSIKNNISAIREAVGDGVKIVAVTKNRSVSEIHEAIGAGITDIGESRVQEAKDKIADLPKGVIKHFIGRLQTNKVRDVVRIFDVIQSVDSLKLAKKIDEECGKVKKIMPILIQVNTSNEPQKGGVKPEELDTLVKQISELPNIKLEGLMTISVDSDNEDDVRKCFRLLNKKFKNMKSNFDFRGSIFDFKLLSMGMSGDYKIAISEGANMVRIGSGIFDVS